MKKTVALFLIGFGISSVYAQRENSVPATADDSVTIHAGVVPLSELLTEEQKNTIKVLNVTGTLLDEDYAFLRTELLNQLQTLNLREAEIDTIPTKAFDLSVVGFYTIEHFRIILPKRLKHVKEFAFQSITDNSNFCEAILTGKFPTTTDVSSFRIYIWRYISSYSCEFG